MNRIFLCTTIIKFEIITYCKITNNFSFRWADDIKSVGRDGVLKKFDHPFFQASTMFLGELACLLTFKILYRYYSRRSVGFGKFID